MAKRKPKMRKLSIRHRRVIDLYFTHAEFQKEKAALMAGYAHRQRAHEIFNRPEVKAEVERRHMENRRKYEITYDRVMEEMAKVGYANLATFMTFDEKTGMFVGFNLNREQMEDIAVIGEVTVETYVEGKGDDAETVRRVKLKPYNKLTALEMMIKHAGLSKDKTGNQNVQVTLVERLRAGRERVFQRDKEDTPDGD